MTDTNTLANFRDIAAAAPGIRPGVYYRSDAPAVGDAPPPAAPNWPPATVYDLRDPGESVGPHGLATVSDVRQIYLFADAAVERLMTGVAAQARASGALDAASDLLDAPAAAIESVLDAWDAHEGGVESWFLAHGGEAATLAALRARLLEHAL